MTGKWKVHRVNISEGTKECVGEYPTRDYAERVAMESAIASMRLPGPKKPDAR